MRKAKVVVQGNDVYMDGHVVAVLVSNAPATVRDAFIDDVLFGANQAHPTLPLTGGLYGSATKWCRK